MRYRAEFYDDLRRFKLENRENGIGGIAAVGASILAHVVFHLFGLDLVVFISLLLAITVAYILSPLGRLGWRARGDMLTIEDGTLRLESRRGELRAALADLSPRAYAGSYRPLGFLPRVRYIRLVVDGGPLGPRELFFAHDGAYAAKAWDALGIDTRPEGHVERALA